ncbi:MAG: hypothetical protein FWD14_07875 [Treponema sp.]|nr:hypothetical protein [Treponema sp.]
MKKITVLLLAAFLTIGTVSAVEGLYAGAELSIADFTADEVIDGMIIRPYVGYETSLDMGLDLRAELGLPITMWKWDDDSETALGLDALLGGTFNLELSDASKLAFSLDTLILFPFDEEKPMTTTKDLGFGLFAGWMAATDFQMYMSVGARFTQTLDFGDLYFGVDMPFILVDAAEYGDDAFDTAMLNFTVGVDNIADSIGAGLTLYNWIGDDTFIDDFVISMDIFGTFTSGPLFASLTVGIPLIEDGIDFFGISITPRVEYALDMGLKFYVELPIFGIAADYDDSIGVGLLFGAKFSF